MKKLLWILAGAALPLAVACNADNDEDLKTYQEWREKNEQWVKEMQNRKNPDGTPYYQTVVPSWDPGSFVLMHYYNDRSETTGNLQPLYTSTVDVRYIGYNCEDEPFDSSAMDNSYGKLGIRRFACNQVIPGWSIALMNMHVGDTVEVIIPYNVGYGASFSGSIMPYSSLRFNIRLDDIYRYEASPY